LTTLRRRRNLTIQRNPGAVRKILEMAKPRARRRLSFAKHYIFGSDFAFTSIG
jgi:hypothetical protein